uniref:Ycf37 n=1 Tax=Fibrocapsa japonica TaxID=94617 RepID=UPI002115A01B|nr:Ycf37 [Fibrocapsa japonica]UTE95201.1 Ycf37 [Fibrocapsa japonica]
MNIFLPFIYTVLISTLIFCIAIILFLQFKKVNDSEKNLNMLQKKISIKKATAEDFFIFGQFFLQKQLYTKALFFFKKALFFWKKTDTIGLSILCNNIGYIYYKLNRNQYSLYYYEQSLLLIPDFVFGLNNLGYIFQKQNLIFLAYKIYLTVLTYDNKNQTAQRNLRLIKNKLDLINRDDRI